MLHNILNTIWLNIQHYIVSKHVSSVFQPVVALHILYRKNAYKWFNEIFLSHTHKEKFTEK